MSWFFMAPYFKEKYRIVLMDFIFQDKAKQILSGAVLISTLMT